MPGNRGGGSPTNHYRRLMQELAEDPEALAEFVAVLRDRESSHFMRARDHAADRAYGPVKQTVELEGVGQVIVAPIVLGLTRAVAPEGE